MIAGFDFEGAAAFFQEDGGVGGGEGGFALVAGHVGA